MKAELFIRPESQRCNELIKFVKKNNLPMRSIDITTSNGYKSSDKYEILRLPTIVIFGKNGNITERLYTIEELKEYYRL